MKIGLFAGLASPFATRDVVLELARGADERGFHSIWLGEHVLLFDEYRSRYPYSEEGRLPGSSENGMLEQFTTLSFMAAVTSRIRVATGICLVPQRNPVYTAKEVAAVDWLSGGRFDFGVGVGWLEEEFQALGVPFERRGARCRDYLALMKKLWSEPVAEHASEFYTLPRSYQDPKPLQQPHPPIHFGGESDAALKRVADLGQGWHGFSLQPDGVAERLAVLERMLAERGRKRAEVEVTICPYFTGCDLDKVKRYRDAGVDQVTLLFFAPSPELVAPTLDSLVEEIVEPASAL